LQNTRFRYSAPPLVEAPSTLKEIEPEWDTRVYIPRATKPKYKGGGYLDTEFILKKNENNK
jgi:hypothetical protein